MRHSSIRILMASIVGLCYPMGVTAEQREAPILNLSYCVKTALARHPGLALAQEEVVIADRRRRVAGMSLLPAVTLKGEETRGRADEATGTPMFLQRSYGAQATQTLFYGGKLWSDRRRATLGSEAARLQAEKQRLDVRHAVAEAYWKVVALEKSRAHYQEVYRLLQEDLEKAARHELSESRSARIQLLSTRVQNRECETALAETEENLVEARAALLDAMGQDRWIQFSVPQDLPAHPIKTNEEECLRLARSNRPELKSAEMLLESARLGRRIGASGYFPRVDLNGFYGRSGAAFIATDPFTYRKDWNAGVRVSWPLAGNTGRYSAFKERTSPRLGESSRTETETQSVAVTLGDSLNVGVESLESKKTLHEEQWRYDKTYRDVEQDVRVAVRRVTSAWARAETAKARLDESQQQLKDVRALFQDDRAHLGDLAAARNRVASAQAAHAQALAHYLTSVSALNRAVGIADHFRVER
jgi:outer membrane protein TolC